MARAKKTTESQILEQTEQYQEQAQQYTDNDVRAGGDDNDEYENAKMFEESSQVFLQVTNHGSRCWVAAAKQWIEEGQSFLTLESESEKQRLIAALVQLNMFANYDRFEWVN